jgi:hypothetical protein
MIWLVLPLRSPENEPRRSSQVKEWFTHDQGSIWDPHTSSDIQSALPTQEFLHYAVWTSDKIQMNTFVQFRSGEFDGKTDLVPILEFGF